MLQIILRWLKKTPVKKDYVDRIYRISPFYDGFMVEYQYKEGGFTWNTVSAIRGNWIREFRTLKEAEEFIKTDRAFWAAARERSERQQKEWAEHAKKNPPRIYK